jgi:hypothetical protein
MNTTVAGKQMAKRQPTRFPGIGKQAQQLGVTREHLRLVLTGERTSAGLLARWQNLTSKQTIKIPKTS